jgi:toxin CcdB
MAQFDVCLNSNPDSAAAIPYLLEIQSNLLESVNTRVVVPLARRSERGRPAKYLNPQFEIEGVQVVMITEQIAGVPKRVLGKKVLSLQIQRDPIMDAIDFLFRGF